MELRGLADGVNRRLGRTAIIFTGVLSDVEPAYACGDVVLGMGTAVLGGMALGKPAIVLGEDGFSSLLDEQSSASLSAVGFWGEGPAAGAVDRMAGHIRSALTDPRRTAHLGELSLALVRARPTKEQTDERVEAVYTEASAAKAGSWVRSWEVGRSLARFIAMRARGRIRRSLGKPGT